MEDQLRGGQGDEDDSGEEKAMQRQEKKGCRLKSGSPGEGSVGLRHFHCYFTADFVLSHLAAARWGTDITLSVKML